MAGIVLENSCQVLIAPGVVLGRILLYGRLTLAVGMGYQFTVSDAHTLSTETIGFYPSAQIFKRKPLYQLAY